MTDAERQEWLWEQLHPMFAPDDGFLPDIFLEPITPADAGVMCALLSAHGQISDHRPPIWLDLNEEEQPLTDLVQAGIIAADAGLASVYTHLVNIRVGPHAIPDLGVGIYTGSIGFDYRMGDGWTPATVDAFFQLLARMAREAPSRRVRVHNEGSEGQHVSPEHFQRTWTQLETTKKSGAATSGVR